MNWEVIDTGLGSAEQNMQCDADLLNNADRYRRPLLHLYEWEGRCATYGYFLNPSNVLNLEAIKQLGISLARRPTGGGVVFHFWDMAFSVLIPATCPEFSQNTLENYAFVNEAVLAAVKEYLGSAAPLSLTPADLAAKDDSCNHFCMAKPTKYDVMWEGRKIAGAAQRKTKMGFLHQGTIALCLPDPDLLAQILLPETLVAEAMQAHTFSLIKSEVEISVAKERLRALLATHLCRASDRLVGKIQN